MNILVIEVGASTKAGGAEKSMRRFSEYLAHSNKVYLGYSIPGDLTEDYKFSYLYSGFVRLYLPNLELTSLVNWTKDIFKLYLFIKKNKIDLIISHVIHVSPLLFVISKISNVNFSIYYKWVCSFQDVGIKVKTGNRSIKNAAAVSDYVLRYWVKNGVSHEAIQVVPEGVSIHEKKEYDNTKKTLTIGFAGRIVKEKGLEDLLQAIKILHDNDSKIELRIAGTFNGKNSTIQDPYHLHIENLIDQFKISNIVFIDGFVDPLEKWFNLIDLVVIPSTCQDAQPLVMMQAMSTGTAVLGSNVGGIPEVLKGEFKALLFPPNDPVSLSLAVQQFLHNPEKLSLIGTELYHYTNKNYSIDKHFDSLCKALKIN